MEKVMRNAIRASIGAATLAAVVAGGVVAAESPATTGSSPDAAPAAAAPVELAGNASGLGKGGGDKNKQGDQLSDVEKQELLKKKLGKPFNEKIVAAAERKLVNQQKHQGARNKSKRKELYFSPQELAQDAAVALGVGGAGVAIWWAAKLLSPACGPALPVCAVVL